MLPSKLNHKNTVFFSTANDSYVFQAATSLLSIRQFIPNAKLFILSRKISKKNKKLLSRRSIQYIELDLTYLFFQCWDYPIECYYLFAGPKLFNKLGYKYSVYLDGDTICLNNPLANCPPIHDIGGVRTNSFSDLFGPEKDALAQRFSIPVDLFSDLRIQSGIVYMNNKALSELDFLNKCGNLFHDAWKCDHPRKGDDSLFALFQLVFHDAISPTFLQNDYNYLPKENDTSIKKSVVFFHFTIDKPWKRHPYHHNNANQNIYNQLLYTWRKTSRKTSFRNWFNTLSLPMKINQLMSKAENPFKSIPFVIKGTRLSTRKKRINRQKPAIKIYWWEPQTLKNFGDIVSPDIISNIFGNKTVWSSIETCELIATGSIIEIATKTKRKKSLYSWGSGFIDPKSKNKNLKQIKFSAIRGEKSLSRITYNVPTGDPGILINATYLLKRKKHSKKIGVVIHYADIKTEFAKQFCEDLRFEVITPLDSPKNVAKKISECSLILSSSLHGIIFADSLSIPNAHIKLSNNLTGGTYKFLDYCSGVNKPYQTADLKRIFDDHYLEQLKKSYRPIPNLTKKQRTLIKAFPF